MAGGVMMTGLDGSGSLAGLADGHRMHSLRCLAGAPVTMGGMPPSAAATPPTNA